MKRILLLLAAALTLVCCKNSETEQSSFHSDWTYDSVVYEMNVRQMTPEGTFEAAAGRLPMLKDLGVDIVWLMPVHPIGVLERKGTLGSYYAPKDYRAINPEYGTMEDFQAFLDRAHELGLKVILDWVANHTSPDSEWAEKHPDWFLHDEKGKFVVQHDWTDIAPMDLSNEEMRSEMRDCLRFWLDKGVDGFRCDVAGEMPVEYWESMITPLRKEYAGKYWLAEGEKPELHTAGFDATYSWELHHMLNDIAQGNATIDNLVEYIKKDSGQYPQDAFRLAFTSNHDENAWAGTEFERMGDAWKAMTVLCWTLPNTQPLIYTGQEVGMHHRFEFFEKDPMPSSDWNAYTDFYCSLTRLKHTQPDLQSGGKGGEFEILSTEANTLVFRRGSVKVSVQLEAPWDYSITTAADAVTRIEPLSWWVGMKTPLQLLVQGEGIGEYSASIDAEGVKVTGVHKAQSPNYLFVDVEIDADAAPGIYNIEFSSGAQSFSVPYEIAERRAASSEREGFGTSDLIYLIMPDRFANGDPTNDNTAVTAELADRSQLPGRHGGDIQGIIDHLDYLEELGVTAIWNTPLLEDNEPESSYHGYACSDYYHIDSRFGSNESYRELVRKCHERGIKMIMDIVTNHCGSAHWWMADLPFEDWIHQWPEYTHSNCDFAMPNDIYASDKDRYNMQSGWFDTSMPDMNLDNPYLLQYFKQYAVWWTEWADLDGLRVDTYPYNEKEPMSQWCKALMEEYPNYNIVGEVWTNNIAQLAYWQGGALNRDGFDSNLPSIMDFPLQSAFCQGINSDYESWDEGLAKVYDAVANTYYYADPKNILVFSSNHDTERIGNIVNRDPARQKMILALTATIRGIAQIFAGDEQMFVTKGGWHRDGALRVDFPGGWEGDSFNLFTDEGRRACNVDFDGAPLKAGVRAEVFDYARALFNWRKGCEAIRDGQTLHFLRRDNTYAFFRYTDDDVVYVMANNTPFDITVPWADYEEFTSTRSLGAGKDVITGETVDFTAPVTVGPRQALIVEFTK